MPWLQQTHVRCDNQRDGEMAFFRSTINATCVRTDRVKAFVFSVLYVASHIASHCGVVFGSLLSVRRLCVLNPLTHPEQAISRCSARLDAISAVSIQMQSAMACSGWFKGFKKQRLIKVVDNSVHCHDHNHNHYHNYDQRKLSNEQLSNHEFYVSNWIVFSKPSV